MAGKWNSGAVPELKAPSIQTPQKGQILNWNKSHSE